MRLFIRIHARKVTYTPVRTSSPIAIAVDGIVDQSPFVVDDNISIFRYVNKPRCDRGTVVLQYRIAH